MDRWRRKSGGVDRSLGRTIRKIINVKDYSFENENGKIKKLNGKQYSKRDEGESSGGKRIYGGKKRSVYQVVSWGRSGGQAC